MRVDNINNTDFQAGKLRLLNVKPESLLNTNALKEIAERRNVDICVHKKDGEKYLTNYDMYFVKCTKTIKNCFNAKKIKTYYSLGLTIHPKKVVPETLSENLYNAAQDAVMDIYKKDTGLRIKEKLMNLVENNPLYTATKRIFIG